MLEENRNLMITRHTFMFWLVIKPML